jgi:hypothetical protein
VENTRLTQDLALPADHIPPLAAPSLPCVAM